MTQSLEASPQPLMFTHQHHQRQSIRVNPRVAGSEPVVNEVLAELQTQSTDRCDMFTIEEYYPEPGKLRYLVKRDGQLLFGFWPEELTDLKTALQALFASGVMPWRESATEDQKRTSASD